MFFEIDDIKRRHSVYFTTYNTHGTIDTYENNMSWNYQRGVMASVPALMLNEYAQLFKSNYKLLRKTYEPPKNLTQLKIFFKEVRNMDNFRLGLKNRLQYGALIGFADVGLRLAIWKWLTGGIYRSWAGADFEFWRKILPTVFVSALTSWFSIPFEVSRAAYYADRTYPKELQKGYTSILNTLRRIPQEEGIFYLFKGSLPIMLKNYFSFSFLVYLYDFTIEKS